MIDRLQANKWSLLFLPVMQNVIDRSVASWEPDIGGRLLAASGRGKLRQTASLEASS